jgi:hypothetical protein
MLYAAYVVAVVCYQTSMNVKRTTVAVMRMPNVSMILEV